MSNPHTEISHILHIKGYLTKRFKYREYLYEFRFISICNYL
nr:MAG TPA: hypothetical protein [Bacteriophage sp.]